MPQARNPSPTHPIVTFPTESVADVLLITEHDTRLPSYQILAYGTAYAGVESDRFPSLKLVFQEPMEADQWIRRYWAADRADQEDYNAAYQYSGGSSTHPIYIRTYILPQATYAPVAAGTADPIYSAAKLVEEVAEPTEKMAGYLTVKRVYETLPGPALTGKEVSSQFGGGVLTITKQDVVPGTSVSGGLNVVEAAVVPVSAGKSTLQKTELPSWESWPTLREEEFVAELEVFTRTEKTFVENIGARTGTKTGGTGGNDIVVTEYKDYDKWKTIQIVSKFPFDKIGSTRTFRKAINYPIPDEIPVTPRIIKAYSVRPPPVPEGSEATELDGLIAESRVTDAKLDFQVVEGYRGSLSATVTRTIDTTSSTETEYLWKPAAAMRNIAVSLNYNEAASQGYRGKILTFQTPSAIHGAWDIPVVDIFEPGSSTVYEYTDSTFTTQIPGSPRTFAPNERIVITSVYYRLIPSFTRSTLNFTVPATTPAAIPHGSTIIAAVNSEQWRFGLWVNDVYRIVVP